MTERAAAAGGGTKKKLQCACARVRRGTPACACTRVRIGTQGGKKTEGAAIKKKNWQGVVHVLHGVPHLIAHSLRT